MKMKSVYEQMTGCLEAAFDRRSGRRATRIALTHVYNARPGDRMTM
ncbi:hypothetical protein [Brevibacillus fortis]